MDKTKLIEEYIEAKRIIKDAEEKMKVLGMQIKAFAEVDDVYDIGDAAVSCMKGKPKYTYSPALTETEKKLKEAQKIEVQSGIAEVSYGESFLQVNFKK